MSKFEMSIEDIINEHIKEDKPLTFTYTDNSPYEHRYNKVYTVEPSIIKDDLLITREFHDGANNFFIKYIHPCVESPSGSERSECEGCVNELANQQGHMGVGGCLSEKSPSKKEPKIISKRHAFDCGFLWDYENDCCECGEKEWTRILFDDGTREVLNNM